MNQRFIRWKPAILFSYGHIWHGLELSQLITVKIEPIQTAVDTIVSMNFHLRKGLRLPLVVASLLMLTSASSIAAPKVESHKSEIDLASLDSRFQLFSTHFYASLAHAGPHPKFKTMNALAETVEREHRQGQLMDATANIMSNLDLVEKNVDTSPIINIFDVLLEANGWNTASQLFKKLKKHADQSLVSSVSFLFAKHYFARNQWSETITTVESVRSDLAPEDYHYTLLMQGISLQRLQKHRLALAQYAKIPKSSQYYTSARLNMAVANIRQDWWTDAHIIIKDLLSQKDAHRSSQITDRLYTVLGYSLLQQQYYRNSREAFRNVSLDGPYTNKALLGIALAAAYQEDYIGALNAIKNLKESKIHDLPVDEANLLMPYFYEKLQQQTTASAGYVDAIAYYETRVGNLKGALAVDASAIRAQLISADQKTISIDGELVELGEKFPPFVFDNIRLLVQFEPLLGKLKDTSLQREYSALTSSYNAVLVKIAQTILDERISYLTHYMNQSRYGLARLQDLNAGNPQ
jgi:hypothetical protein